MLPDIVGIINSWLAGKHFHNKGSEELAKMKEELKGYIDNALHKAIAPLLKQATSEQRNIVYSAIENSTEAITDKIISLSGTITAQSNVSGMLSVNGIDRSSIKPKPSAGPGPEDEYTP